MRVVTLRACAFVTLLLSSVTISSSRIGAAPGQGSSSAGQVSPLRRVVQPVVEVPRLTRIEALLATAGVVAVADYYPIDMRFGPGLAVDAVVASAVGTGSRLRGLRIQVNDDRRPNPREEFSYLDFDELAGLSRSLGTIVELTTKWTGRDAQRNTELSYVSNSGFRLAVHQSIRTQRVSAFTGFVEPVSTTIDVTDLPAFKDAIDQAMALLNGK